jgi:hypothetical protein
MQPLVRYLLSLFGHPMVFAPCDHLTKEDTSVDFIY